MIHGENKEEASIMHRGLAFTCRLSVPPLTGCGGSQYVGLCLDPDEHESGSAVDFDQTTE